MASIIKVTKISNDEGKKRDREGCRVKVIYFPLNSNIFLHSSKELLDAKEHSGIVPIFLPYRI
jgi:hypothetical protein